MSEANTTWKHSQARLPRLYKQAGRIVQQIKEEGGSFKGLVFKSKQRNLKSLYALVAETLRHSSELDDLLRKTQILIKEPRLDPWVARVLITELLWRERPLSGPAIPLKIVLSYKPQLLSSQADLPKTDTPAVVNISRPRYVRINSLKVMKQEVLSFLKERGWEELNCSKQKLHYPDFIQTISTLSDNQFVQDVHIENLLVFPRNVQFYNMDYFHDSSLILQDKASCMVAHLLNPEPGSTVLDMCAAPGMKTTHIAASLNNRGTVYAIEKHRERYQSLVSTVAKSGATCVKTILGDALHFSHHRLPDVEYIVVDPTCSGSGMTARQDVFNDSTEVSKLRLNKLSGFQYTILTHAMTNFPKVKRILYSTCSMSPEENEAVVDDVLRNSPPNFKPIIPENGAWWMTPGSSSYTYGKYGLYAKPDTDLTNGFFVAVFERTDNDYESKERGNLKKESSEEVNKVENKKQENSNLSKPKMKKKKQKNSDSVSSPKPSINPALERMKKAMQNLGTINSGDDHSEILTKKRKKSESETFHKVEDQAEEILPKQKKKGKK